MQVAGVVTDQSLQLCPSIATGLVSGGVTQPTLKHERVSTPAVVQVAGVVTDQALQLCPSAGTLLLTKLSLQREHICVVNPAVRQVGGVTTLT